MEPPPQAAAVDLVAVAPVAEPIDATNTESAKPELVKRKTGAVVSNGQSAQAAKRQKLPVAAPKKAAKKGTGAKGQGIANLTVEAVKMPYYTDAHGLRHVPPYVHEFQTFAKDRWVGTMLLDVYCSEFAGQTREYYAAAISGGRITVNSAIVSPDYKVEAHDLLCHRVHRHELPVAGGAISIIAETSDMLVADKPATMPVHPCGAYRYNSLVCILAHQLPQLAELHVCHRLDRLTSGLVIFAKSRTAAGAMCSTIRDSEATKTYLARVKGDFNPAAGPAAAAQWKGIGAAPAMHWRELLAKSSSSSSTSSSSSSSSSISVSAPIRIVSYRQSLYECHPEGKAATTVVRKLRYHAASDTSVVECTPQQGRTHQLRLHLQYLGHPIANDPCYGGALFAADPVRAAAAAAARTWLLERGCECKVDTGADGDDAGVAADVASSSASAAAVDAASADSAAATAAALEAQYLADLAAGYTPGESEEQFVQRTCRQCFGKPPDAPGTAVQPTGTAAAAAATATASRGASSSSSSSATDSVEPAAATAAADSSTSSSSDSVAYQQQQHEQQQQQWTCAEELAMQALVRSPGIWLHAHRYEGEDWRYESALPQWATFDD
jgi:tRNA pseudouridine32 synthase